MSTSTLIFPLFPFVGRGGRSSCSSPEPHAPHPPSASGGLHVPLALLAAAFCSFSLQFERLKTDSYN